MNASAKSCVNMLPSLIYEHNSRENIFIDSKDKECTDKEWPNSPAQWGTAAHQGTQICWLSWDNPTFHISRLICSADKDNFLPTMYTRLYWIPVCTPFHPHPSVWSLLTSKSRISPTQCRQDKEDCCLLQLCRAGQWIKHHPNHHGLLGTTYYFIPLFLVDCQNKR